MQQILLLRATLGLGTGMRIQYPQLRGWHDRTGCCAVGGLARENAKPEAREVLQKKATVVCVVLTPVSILSLARVCSAGRKGLVSCWKLGTCPCMGQAYLQ